MKQEASVIGVDLGGTNMRAGLVKGQTICAKEANSVPKTDDPKVVLNQLIRTIEAVMEPGVEGIGIGVPSLVKTSEGIVYNVQNIPSWKEIRLKELLEGQFKLPVYVNNDANCFAVGERYFGEGRRFTDFVGLITGTGVGGGIVKNGHLLPDQNCGAGEFGMISYLDHDYEYYCSGQFFDNFYGISGGDMARLAKNGDPTAKMAFKLYGAHLGKAIKTILLAVDPEAIVLGGSVAKSFEYYNEAMWAEIRTHDFPFVIENLKIVPSNVDEIAILGAAALYLDQQ